MPRREGRIGSPGTVSNYGLSKVASEVCTVGNSRYPWKRFFVQRGGVLHLSNDGYLEDPETANGRAVNPEVVPFESIDSTPCLVLLGEPGMGKTKAMEDATQSVRSLTVHKGEDVLSLDLRSYQSEQRLANDLFGNAAFISWSQGKRRLHVFIDSLDECLLKVTTVAAVLADELKKYPRREGLLLRIACRTAAWPALLEDELEKRWGHGSVGIYELAPLRRKDISLAACVEGLDAGAFMKAVARSRAEPLAIRPVTLKFLLSTFAQTGTLLSTQKDLYLRGCLILCTEANESRIVSPALSGALTPEQRLEIASRIAAVTILSNRYAVWTAPDLGCVPDSDVSLSDLCGGTESVSDSGFEVTPNALREALDTGLFSSRGPNQMGWSHRSYSEFLAARYLANRSVPYEQLTTLMLHPSDPDGKLVPQLHGMVAWLAGMRDDVLQAVMRIEPEVLLSSDAATVSEDTRVSLVSSLLRAYETGLLVTRNSGASKLYGRLAHTQLRQQLQPYITDGRITVDARQFAIDVADACEVQCLLPDLARVALNATDPESIRVNAAYAIARWGNVETRSQLVPLVRGGDHRDPNDELKGVGLLACWPNVLSTAEVLAVLTEPKQDSFFGVYSRFISEFTRALAPTDLIPALEWVRVRQHLNSRYSALDDLVNKVMLMGWQYFEQPGVPEAYAKAFLSMAREREQPLKAVDFSNAPHRRHLVEYTMPLLSGPEDSGLFGIITQPGLISKADTSWLLERLISSDCVKTRSIFARLVRWAMDVSDADAIFEAMGHSDELRAEVGHWFEPVALGSEKAATMKEYHESTVRLQTRGETQTTKPGQSPSTRALSLLDKFEQGTIDAFWQLNLIIAQGDDAACYGKEFELDLTVLPGWREASAETRRRIVTAAQKYLQDGEPKESSWLGTQTWYRPAVAGYRALYLLCHEAQGIVLRLDGDLWRKWASAVAWFGAEPKSDNSAFVQLIELTYRNAAQEYLRTVSLSIDSPGSEGRVNSLLRKLRFVWDGRIAELLLTKVRERHLPEPVFVRSLIELMKHHVADAKVFAESLVSQWPHKEGAHRRLATMACLVLVGHSEGTWPLVWSAIRSEPEFGADVLTELSHSDEYGRLDLNSLSEEHLAALYSWLCSRFPHSEDPKHDGAYLVSPRDSVASLRNEVLHHLSSRGTIEAGIAIRALCASMPDAKWLPYVLQDAEAIALRQTWVAPNARSLLQLFRRRENRFVDSGNHLLEVLRESLDRLQQELAGETPIAPFMWNMVEAGKFRPRSEEDLSDFIKVHLADDLVQTGIIVNREVQIRRGSGRKPGQRTDIHVDTVMPEAGHASARISAIIEVKGCWNPSLHTDMKSQLVDRYLAENRCPNGLYLVVWFNPEQWDPGDPRRREALRLAPDRGELTAKLERHSKSLSVGGTTIVSKVLDASF